VENLYDRSASKKATNLTINHDLLRQARELKINLSQTLEERLVEIIAQRRREQWLAENRRALEDYNRRIEEHGVFSHGLRRF
jgi:antitoxin CcdA